MDNDIILRQKNISVGCLYKQAAMMVDTDRMLLFGC